MSQLKLLKADLLRIALLLFALVESSAEMWKVLLPFDAIALIATVVGGYPMFSEALEAIRERKMTMELSMSMAVIATLCIGEFFTGAVITLFVLCAEILEHMLVARGRDVIGKLVDMIPHHAIVRRNGIEEEIEINALAADDVVVIKPGMRIPVDGIVRKGNSSVDQSSITGESMPLEKQIGDMVLAGTVNQHGIIEVETTSIGRDTTFGKIIEVIEQAERTKAPIQKVADTLAARLVYFAIGGAVLTFIVTHNIMFSISALIVAGACGVAAGTPLAILAGIGRTAKEGIIVKGGIYLEQLATVDTIVLDKTGTLTLGKPQVVNIEPFGSASVEAVLRFAACAEQHSEHPIADAIVRNAKEKNISVPQYVSIQQIPGKGMICVVDGNEILVGNAAMLDEKSVAIPNDVAGKILSRKNSGDTNVWVVNNGVIIGVIGVADVIRSEAASAVMQMEQMGCRTVLLTGDSAATGDAVGKILHVDEVHAEMLPHKKLEIVQSLIAAGKKVAMVGDGVNDAPALVAATVGIAMGRGTDVALESADMVLSTDNLSKIVEALRISRRCMQVIAFNFWGTILVDIAGVALAFCGVLTPLVAAMIHVTSELAFILNSARLFRDRSRKNSAN